MSKQETPLQRLIAELKEELMINYDGSTLYKHGIESAIEKAESILKYEQNVIGTAFNSGAIIGHFTSAQQFFTQTFQTNE